MEVEPQTTTQEPEIQPVETPQPPAPAVEVAPAYSLEGLETARENYFFPEYMFSVEAASLEEAQGKLKHYLANQPKSL